MKPSMRIFFQPFPHQPTEIVQKTEGNIGKSTNNLVCGVRKVQNSHQHLLEKTTKKADILTELKERLAERASGTDMTDTSQALKPWQLELAKGKAEYDNSAPERKAAEVKEDARVAAAFKAEAAEAEAEKQKTAAAQKAKVVPTLKLDTNGIPFPPPPPPSMMASVNPLSIMNKATAGEQGKKSPNKSVFTAVIDELTRKLAKRTGNANMVEINPTVQLLKPWQAELVRVKAEYDNSAPERKAAEVKEDARVAAALKAEAAEAEAEKQKTAAAQKAKVAPTLKLDTNGIPFPPPPPSVKHFPPEKFSQTIL